MSPQIQSPSQRPDTATTTTTTTNSTSPSISSASPSPLTILQTHRLPILLTTYALLTSTLLYRVSRSPLSTSRKWQQAETIVKATTLGGVVVGVGVAGGWGRRRSEVLREKEVELEHEKGEGMGEEAKELVRGGGVQRN